METQGLPPASTQIIDLKKLLLPDIQSIFKEMMMDLLKPLHLTIETLRRNNNELVISNNSLVKAVNDLKQKNTSLSQRVVDLETTSQKPGLTAKQIHVPPNTTRLSPTKSESNKRTPTVMGSGKEVGVRRFLHIAVTRLPLKDSIDGNFLTSTVNKEINEIGAKVTEATPMRSEKHTDPPKTKSFKLTIAYDGNPADIYQSHFYPANVKVTRFNFPRDRRKRLNN